jgi:single-stranded DNA-binding protein
MNQMNQVIVEGTVRSVRKEGAGQDGRKRLVIGMESVRSYMDSTGKKSTETSSFTVKYDNPEASVREGEAIRVVGRLSPDRPMTGGGKDEDRLIVTAEHIGRIQGRTDVSQISQVIIEGYVQGKPELRRTAAGTGVCPIRLVSVRSGQDGKDEVTPVAVTTSGRMAEITAKHASEGRHIRVVGRLVEDRWRDTAGNTERSMIKIIGEHVEFMPTVTRKVQEEKPDRADRREEEPDGWEY